MEPQRNKDDNEGIVPAGPIPNIINPRIPPSSYFPHLPFFPLELQNEITKFTEDPAIVRLSWNSRKPVPLPPEYRTDTKTHFFLPGLPHANRTILPTLGMCRYTRKETEKTYMPLFRNSGKLEPLSKARLLVNPSKDTLYVGELGGSNSQSCGHEFVENPETWLGGTRRQVSTGKCYLSEVIASLHDDVVANMKILAIELSTWAHHLTPEGSDKLSRGRRHLQSHQTKSDFTPSALLRFRNLKKLIVVVEVRKETPIVPEEDDGSSKENGKAKKYQVVDDEERGKIDFEAADRIFRELNLYYQDLHGTLPQPFGARLRRGKRDREEMVELLVKDIRKTVEQLHKKDKQWSAPEAEVMVLVKGGKKLQHSDRFAWPEIYEPELVQEVKEKEEIELDGSKAFGWSNWGGADTTWMDDDSYGFTDGDSVSDPFDFLVDDSDDAQDTEDAAEAHGVVVEEEDDNKKIDDTNSISIKDDGNRSSKSGEKLQNANFETEV